MRGRRLLHRLPTGCRGTSNMGGAQPSSRAPKLDLRRASFRPAWQPLLQPVGVQGCSPALLLTAHSGPHHQRSKPSTHLLHRGGHAGEGSQLLALQARADALNHPAERGRVGHPSGKGRQNRCGWNQFLALQARAHALDHPAERAGIGRPSGKGRQERCERSQRLAPSRLVPTRWLPQHANWKQPCR